MRVNSLRSVKTDPIRRASTVSLFRRGSTFRYRSEPLYIVTALPFCHSCTSYESYMSIFFHMYIVVGLSTSCFKRELACAREGANDSRGKQKNNTFTNMYIHIYIHVYVMVRILTHTHTPQIVQSKQAHTQDPLRSPTILYQSSFLQCLV